MTDSDRAALRECPFDNGVARTVKREAAYPTFVSCWVVYCEACGVQKTGFDTEAEAIAAWNTRAPGYAAGVEAAARVCEEMAPNGVWDDNDRRDHSAFHSAAARIRQLALAAAVPEEQIVERVARAICRMCSGTRMKADDAWELCKSLGSDNEVRRFARDAIAALRGE